MTTAIRTMWTVLAVCVGAMIMATLAAGQMGPGGAGGPRPEAPGAGPQQSMGMGAGPQQGMGMGMGEGMGGGPQQGMGRGADARMGRGPGVGIGHDDITVGPDGTAYLLRRVVATPSGASTNLVRTELVAINVRDGAPRWKLELPAGMVSEPVLGKDGKIFLTIVERQGSAMQPGAGTPGSGANMTGSAKLLVVSADLVAARITNTVTIGSGMASPPTTAPDETGNYVVYVIGTDRTTATRESYLYAFLPDGRVKFKVKLSEAPVGMPARP